jgi:hypothetical protein
MGFFALFSLTLINPLGLRSCIALRGTGFGKAEGRKDYQAPLLQSDKDTAISSENYHKAGLGEDGVD